MWPSLAEAITIGALTATFVGILWYAVDARRLVEGRERAAERQRYPWLDATTLEPEFILPSDGEAAFGGFHIWLPITNVGHTPALDLEITTQIEVIDQEVKHAPALEKRSGQTLVPQGVLRHEVGRVFLGGPRATIRIHVGIAYRTTDGGRADVRVGFINTEQGWQNLPTSYRIWRADGSGLPRHQEDRPYDDNFLLHEYDVIGALNRAIHETRNKTVALYYGLVGVLAATGLTLSPRVACDAPPGMSDRYIGQLMCLPGYVAVPSFVFLLIVTAVTLISLVRCHTLNAEYTTVLNRLRAGFLAGEGRELRPFVILPTGQTRAAVFRANFAVIMMVVAVGTLVVVFAVAYALNAPGLQGIALDYPRLAASVPVLGGVLWVLGWFVVYCVLSESSDRRVARRIAASGGSKDA